MKLKTWKFTKRERKKLKNIKKHYQNWRNKKIINLEWRVKLKTYKKTKNKNYKKKLRTDIQIRAIKKYYHEILRI
jgi:hypothetical protein